jgi:hypothetical protein
MCQRIGEPVGGGAQIGIGEIPCLARFAEPADREFLSTSFRDMTIERLMGDIEAATRKSIEFCTRCIPGEFAADSRVVRQI